MSQKLRTLAPLVRDIEPAVSDRIDRTAWGDLVQPERLPRPTCKVWLVCGPPASGKSSYVRAHANDGDIVIDLDSIAREYGMGRDRPWDATGMLLLERNERLAALAGEPPERTAWAIIGAPSHALRQWWCSALNVPPERLVVLVPPLEELHRRIMADPDRRSVRNLHMQFVDKWLAQDA